MPGVLVAPRGRRSAAAGSGARVATGAAAAALRWQAVPGASGVARRRPRADGCRFLTFGAGPSFRKPRGASSSGLGPCAGASLGAELARQFQNWRPRPRCSGSDTCSGRRATSGSVVSCSATPSRSPLWCPRGGVPDAGCCVSVAALPLSPLQPGAPRRCDGCRVNSTSPIARRGT